MNHISQSSKEIVEYNLNPKWPDAYFEVLPELIAEWQVMPAREALFIMSNSGVSGWIMEGQSLRHKLICQT